MKILQIVLFFVLCYCKAILKHWAITECALKLAMSEELKQTIKKSFRWLENCGSSMRHKQFTNRPTIWWLQKFPYFKRQGYTNNVLSSFTEAHTCTSLCLVICSVQTNLILEKPVLMTLIVLLGNQLLNNVVLFGQLFVGTCCVLTVHNQ